MPLRCMSKWLAKFHAGDFFLLRDAAWSGRPVAVIENHQHYTMRKTAKILKISKSSTVKSLASAWLIAFQTVRSRFRGSEVPQSFMSQYKEFSKRQSGR